MSQLHLATLAAFAALMIAAAIEDVRRLIIPNALTLALLVLWPPYLAGAFSLVGALGALGCAALVFVGGALCFARGYMGGGDVKLLSAATLWVGPAQTPALLLLTALVGGALALFMLLPAGARSLRVAGSLLARTLGVASSGVGLSNAAARPIQVPYGVAIAAAALIVTVPPVFH
jgi:prepilin peptidase CpaA